MREYDRERRQTQPWRAWQQSKRWQKVAAWHKDQHPLCEQCEREGRVTAAYLVDHIIPHNGSAALFWDAGNLQSMCSACHERKHGNRFRGDGRP